MATPSLSSSPVSLLPSLSSLPHKPKTLNLKPLSLSYKRRHLTSLHLHCAPSISTSLLVTHQDLNERDWSFVEPPSEHPRQQLRQVINSASLPSFSRVLVTLPTPRFIDELLDPVHGAEPQHVVAYHESLLMLSNVKESHDEVRCFQGDVTTVPAKFAPFDAIFVCYFPGMGVSVGELLRSHASLCSSGSRVVIFVEQGRGTIEIHRQQFPDMVTSDLPDLKTVEKAVATNGFKIIEFVDEPTFYVAVLALL
ncbi:hypothetical protein LUZ63_017727 [Rhynchospora breviuscula]|uniref:Uncharacterized protein n=1 Tax=Rhynchospora breviuscula TaxID=2022672 RepID=A0A9Q0HGA3_9POAL|nr:hypothetical protein LUZ63_017727 [Rhynchospora breviuscula]